MKRPDFRNYVAIKNCETKYTEKKEILNNKEIKQIQFNQKAKIQSLTK